MSNSRKLTVKYGLGYVFRNNKTIGALDIDSYDILETEFKFEDEVVKIRLKHENQLQELHNKSMKYINCVEGVLGENAICIGLIITSIISKEDGSKVEYTINDNKNDNEQLFDASNYDIKNVRWIKRYIDNCKVKSGKIDYNKNVILKLLNLDLDNFLMTPDAKEDIYRQAFTETIYNSKLEEEILSKLITQIEVTDFDFEKCREYLYEKFKILTSMEGEFSQSVSIIDKNGNLSILNFLDFSYSELIELVLREDIYVMVVYLLDSEDDYADELLISCRDGKLNINQGNLFKNPCDLLEVEIIEPTEDLKEEILNLMRKFIR